MIHLKTNKVLSVLNTYQIPSAYITILLDQRNCDGRSYKEVIDKRVVEGKLCVTVDLRKGEYVYLRK